ncbi:extracellular solute-binding protein [Paraburkholderia sp.]|uniref:extracellular solute-binding protein n=1 Tax=Paraburkholderia sp. TaxID=1926495 RepID=UPI0039E34862
MNTRHSRRTFLKTASGLMLAPSLGLATRPSLAAAACPDVIVGTSGGDYENQLEANVGRLIKAQGGNVTYATADQITRMTKMRAEKNSRHGSMDVTCMADVDMYDMNAAGLLAPATDAAVPNLVNTFEQFRKPYAIPHIFSAMVIIYNPEKFPTPPDSFNAVLDPRVKGRIGLTDILFHYNAMMGALASGDKTGSLDSGMKFLRELKKNQPKVYPSNETTAAALKSGEVWITCMWKARAIQWKKAGLPVAFSFPREGAVTAIFDAAVPKNSQAAACGFNYLNAMLDPRAQRGFAETMGYAPTVRNAALPPALQQQVGFTDAELAKLLKIDYAKVAAQKPGLLDYWNQDFKVGL